MPADPAGGAAYLKRLSLAAPVRLSQGLAMVRGGNLDQPTIPLQMWTVGQLDNPAEAPRIAEPGEG